MHRFFFWHALCIFIYRGGPSGRSWLIVRQAGAVKLINSEADEKAALGETAVLLGHRYLHRHPPLRLVDLSVSGLAALSYPAASPAAIPAMRVRSLGRDQSLDTVKG